MQTRNRNTFTTLHTKGALLPFDLLQRIRSNDASLEGLDAESYHLAPGEKLNEAINRSWNRWNGLWGAFQAARGRLGSNDAGTTLTRERWILPLFQELGFGRLSTSKAVEIEGKSYPISHRWQNGPLHLVGCGIELDERTPGAPAERQCFSPLKGDLRHVLGSISKVPGCRAFTPMVLVSIFVNHLRFRFF